MNSNFLLLLKSILPKVEIGSIAISFIGFLLVYMGRPGEVLLQLGLSVLAAVFFLAAYLPPPTPTNEQTAESVKEAPKKGFMDLLYIILWKVIHIASSVAVIGLLFYMLQLKGYGQILLIGTSTLVGSLFLSGFVVLQKKENWDVLKSAILKGLIMAVIGLYILYINWPLTP